MSLTFRETFTALHGLIFGGLFLLAFSGGLIALYELRPEWVTAEGLKARLARLKAWVWGMAIVVWATVITGTFVVYPWYRVRPPEGATDLTAYPRYLLTSNPATAGWHEFGMEWKEHVAWLAVFAATAVAYVVSAYGPKLANEPKIRKALIWFFVVSFVVSAIAGVLGAFITKAAPVM